MTEIETAVIGAGWAGIAAATELAKLGLAGTLFDAAPQPGGRAKAASIRLAGEEIEVDNGQHLMIGAYRDCLALIDMVSGPARGGYIRRPMMLRATDGLCLETSNLPAPLHLLGGLLRARGLDLREKLAIARLMLGLRLSGWRVRPGETVSQLLDRTGQPTSLRTRLWDPLVLATLNTPSDEACASTFARVLADSLAATPRDSDFVLPERNLSDLLPTPAIDWLRRRGMSVQLGTMVRSLSVSDQRWCLHTNRGDYLARGVIMALPPNRAAQVMPSEGVEACALEPLRAELLQFHYEPIATVYLAWPVSTLASLPAWVMLVEQEGAWGQWLFDRGEQRGLRVASVVISARGRHAHVPGEQIVEDVARQVCEQLKLPPPQDQKIVVEKRATFRCTPNRPKLDHEAVQKLNEADNFAAFARLKLAGDYAYPQYPATLESAVRSGLAAARSLAGTPTFQDLAPESGA